MSGGVRPPGPEPHPEPDSADDAAPGADVDGALSADATDLDGADRFADELAALHRVATLAPGPPGERLDRWLEAGRAIVGARQGVVLLGSGEELVVRAERSDGIGGVLVDDEVADHRVAAAIDRRATVASLRAVIDGDRDADLGSGAVIASPLWVSGEVAGALAFVAGVDDGPFSAWTMALVDVVADGIARVLEHQADVGALVTVESRAAAIVDLIPDPIVRLDREGRHLDDALRAPFDPLAVVRPMGSPVDPGPRVRAAIAESLATGLVQAAVFDAGGGGAAGPGQVVEARFVPAGPDEVLCIVRDVTERRRAEQALAEQVAFEALVASISTRMIGCLPSALDQAIDQGLGEIASFFDADTASILELSLDGSTLVRAYGWSGRAGGGEPERRGERVDVDDFEQLIARFDRAGHVFERTAGTTPEGTGLSGLLEPGDRGGLWVRLGSAGDLSGVVALTWRTREPPGNDEVLALVRFAADAFHGALRRRSVALLAEGQAAVFESIARDAPLATSLSGAADLLARLTLGATVVVLTVGDDGFELVGPGPDAGWGPWFAARSLDLGNPYGQAVVTGEPVAIYDARRDPRFAGHAVPDPALRAAAVLPVRSSRHGRTVAVVAMYARSPGPLLPRASVRDSALSLVAVALERAHDLQSLAHQATHDPLTGVGNRATLLDRLSLALARSDRTGRQVAVLFCDLDGFKDVNDRLGHDRGDQLLVEVARRISGAVRPSDTVSRSGGDEFVVVCDDLDHPDQAEVIAERVRIAVGGSPVVLGGVRLPVAVSVGVAVADEATSEPDRLLRAADLAMYEHKGRRRAGIEVDPRPLARPGRSAHHDLSADELRAALAADELDLHQQPIVGRDGSLAGVEVLLRWTRPDGSSVGPGPIVAVADAEGLAVALGRWVRRRALAVRSTWPPSPHRLIRPPVHVNVSGSELRARDFVDQVDRDLDELGVRPDQLALEVRELDLHRVEARTAVADLHHLGVRVLVDGAGEGGLGLGELAHLPVAGIKLPPQLVRGLDRDDTGIEVVRSLVLLAHGVGWRSLAVGVETDHQRSVLFGFGVDAVQGRAVTMPVASDAFREWLVAREAT